MAELITQRASHLSGLSVFADCFGADLYGLAASLEPLHLDPGEVLMEQGDTSHFFAILADGSVAIRHEDGNGAAVEMVVPAGEIVGEIAMLKNQPRVASVVATTEVTGWRGGDDAFAELIQLPGVLRNLVRTARQRLAAFLTPIPVRMRDGSEMQLRPALPGDKEMASHGHVQFSAETLYRRFMSFREPNQQLMSYLFEVDYVDHFVWVITAEDDEVVADARFVRDESKGTTAEVAFIVADAYQGRGVGSFLMKAVAIAAEVAGVEQFTARVLSENLSMRRILDGYGAHWEREDLGVVMTVLPVPERRRIKLPKDLADRIAGLARQAIKAVG
ncbi:GNAT family N-acetyltransferase [[Mycobacterium] burgundiense]|uniref:GNAT family N-acetyltransferase n=1 Tax=[Mycobacterium] burgundiense TaxID=3064286 RepID=A0ABN9MY93_9MYCO|nr:GNAT family N-acetyltransferase [Mycolicibacterium sp. MU0053]CAJ1497219.1 GNAT family N-acetyltransferase [Mycolicibacterium sp. MU0053]